MEVKRRFIKPGCPWTNGKGERLHYTLLTGWAHGRTYTSSAARRQALTGDLRIYTTKHGHTAHRGRPPISTLAA